MSIYWICHSRIYMGLGLEKFRFLPLYIGFGTWKNSTPELSPRLWDLKKFRALPLCRLWDFKKFHARPPSFLLDYMGLGKILSLASYRL